MGRLFRFAGLGILLDVVLSESAAQDQNRKGHAALHAAAVHAGLGRDTLWHLALRLLRILRNGTRNAGLHPDGDHPI